MCTPNFLYHISMLWNVHYYFKGTHTVTRARARVSQPAGLRLRCRYGNESTSMFSDNIFNSVWLLPLLFQQQQKVVSGFILQRPHCWFSAAEMLMKREMERVKKKEKKKRGTWWQVQRAAEKGANRWIFKVRQYCLTELVDEGRHISRGREGGRDGQWWGDGKKKKRRDAVIPLSRMTSHSSVNSSPPNPNWSTAHSAMTHAAAEQGAIKHTETNTPRKVRKIWKRAEKKMLEMLAEGQQSLRNMMKLSEPMLQFRMRRWHLQNLHNGSKWELNTPKWWLTAAKIYICKDKTHH